MSNEHQALRLFLCGDVMLGRGIDQILQNSVPPKIYEPFVEDARDYIYLAEEVNGKINYPVTKDYVWGDCLSIWKDLHPNIKICNLETAITKSNEYWPEKGINYRMHPKNISVLKAANFDVCELANNHMLDWGYSGLEETLATLKEAEILFTGAGRNNADAMKPAIFNLISSRRILVFSCGHTSSGITADWSATANNPGIFLIPDLSAKTIDMLNNYINHHKQPGDLIIFSIHWGTNWGYEIPEYFRKFAHSLIDTGSVDLIHGHSSHHPRPIELYQGKPILYGCGDFINDYEGISGYQEYRGDLTLMYFLDFDDQTLKFKEMTLFPMQIKNFRLHLANEEDSEWMLGRLNQSLSTEARFFLEKEDSRRKFRFFNSLGQSL